MIKTAEITLNKQQIYSGNLVLVNAANPLKTDAFGELAPATARFPQILINRCAANVLQHLLYKLNAQNRIDAVSGYRCEQEQKQIYINSLIENGEEYTKKYVALPGCSEHQTGLAIDLARRAGKIDFICPGFPYTGICESFRKAAPQYGFIQRYTKEKEHITGISHEPWHFRYIGYPHSEIICNYGISLEEYICFLKSYSAEKPLKHVNLNGQCFEIYYVPFIDEPPVINLPDKCVHQISGNNIDGFIVTVWRKEND